MNEFKRKVKKIVQNFLWKRGRIVVPTIAWLGGKRAEWVRDGEYIRLSSLELCATEIYEKHIEGCVAECGVYMGNFAKNINKAFPDRKLYLFDTFEGFDEKDVKIDATKGYSSGEQDFSATSIELVLHKMQYPENVIVKKGYFPETVDGIDEDFVFVSLDMDLYKPMYDGLCYFYPRLKEGGYIFIHDYNNVEYKGVKSAVNLFMKEQNKVCCFPLSDSCRTLVIMK
jgi:O-methyltransferase